MIGKTTKIIITNRPYTKDSKGFYIMPNELHYLLYDIGLTAQEKLIYECLIRYSNNSENNPFPSYNTLQKFASCSRATVSKSLKNLQSFGLVEVLHKGTKQGDSNIYKINYVYKNTEASQEATRSPQKAFKGSNSTNTPKKKEKAVIPFKRGCHDSIVTSKEAEDNLKEYEANQEVYAGTEERGMAFLEAL